MNVHGSDAIEITLDSEGLTNINKGFKEKEELGITTGKKQFEGLFDALSKKVASIKRHFMASPYEMMLEVIAANSKDKTSKAVGNLSFYTKGGKKEKTWIAFESTLWWIQKINSQSTMASLLKIVLSNNLAESSSRYILPYLGIAGCKKACSKFSWNFCQWILVAKVFDWLISTGEKRKILIFEWNCINE